MEKETKEIVEKQEALPTKNQPYIKKYNGNGEVINPIEQDKPYLHNTLITRQMRRGNIRIIPVQLSNDKFSFEKQRKVKSQKRISDWITI